jgi:hypothetical protein
MLQVFYIDLAYVVVVIHMCCKVCFNCFTFVSVCCNRCCSPRALTHGQARSAPDAPAPPGPPRWSMRPAQHMCMRAMLPPSLSHWVMRAVIPLFQDLSYWGTCVVFFLSHWGTRILFPLSLACSWARPRTCSSGQVQQRKEAWGATVAGGACSKKSKKRHRAHQMQQHA